MITWLFMALVVTILFTPGPTNTLLASSGIQVGVRRSLMLVPAEALGYVVAISAWGLLIGYVSDKYPAIPSILKLFSASYILYLAIKLWRTQAPEMGQSQEVATIRARELFYATLLNPKALLFASAVFPAIVWKNSMAYTSHMLVFIFLIIPIAIFWTCLGAFLVRKKLRWLTPHLLQKFASVILVFFCIPLSYSAFTSL